MDITTLGIGVDSSQVGQGSSALDELTRAALKAAEAMDKVGSKGGKGGDDAAKGIFKGTIAADAFKKGVEIAIESVKQLYSLMSQAGDFADLGREATDSSRCGRCVDGVDGRLHESDDACTCSD